MGTGTETIKKDKSYNTFSTIIFSLLCLLIFYPPFFQGLFFTKGVLITHIVSFSLFIAYLMLKKLRDEKIVLESNIDYIGVLLIFAYMLPIIFGQWANLRDAIGAVLKTINVFVVYLMVKDFNKEKENNKIILNVLVFSGLMTALIGIAAVSGLVQLQDAIMGNRIASTFQYPNTLAAFMMTLFFICFALMEESEKLWQKVMYSTVGFIMLFTFIFTYSRGAWLLFPIFAVVLILLIPNKTRVHAILYLIIATVPSIFSMQPFTKALEAEGEVKVKALYIFMIGSVVFIALSTLVETIKMKITEKHYKYIYTVVGGCTILTIIALYIALNTTQPLIFDNTNIENRGNIVQRSIKNVETKENYVLKVDVISESIDEKQWPWRIEILSIDEANKRKIIAERLGQINETGEVDIDFATLEDTKSIIVYFTNVHAGTKVIFDDATIYSSEQELTHKIKLSYKYIPETIIRRFDSISLTENSSSTRLTYYKDGLEIFKNYSIIGAGGGAWNSLYPKYQSELYYSTEAHNFFIQTLVEVGSVGIILWFLLVLSLMIFLFKSIKIKNNLNIIIIVSIVSLLGHSLLDFNFSYLSITLLLWVLLSLLDQQITVVIKLKFKPIKINSLICIILILPALMFSTSLLTGFVHGQKAVNVINQGEQLEALNYFEKAIKYDPFNESYRYDLTGFKTSIASQTGDGLLIQDAEKHGLKALKYSPNNLNGFQSLINVYITMGDFEKAYELTEKALELAPFRPSTYDMKVNTYITVGNYFTELGDFNETLSAFNKVTEVIDDLTTFNRSAIKPILLSSYSMELITKCKYFIENIVYQEKLGKIQNLVFANYLNIDVDEDGIPDEWKIWNRVNTGQSIVVNRNGVIINNTKGNTGGIYSNNIELQPQTQYYIEIEFDKNTSIQDARISVISSSGNYLQHQQNILNNNYEIIQFETTANIEAGNQYIIIEHKGTTSNPLLVKNIKVFKE